MIIRTRRSQEAVLAGDAGKMTVGLGRMTAGDHLDAFTAALAKFTQQLTQFPRAQLVARRMRHHRPSARADYPFHRVGERGPLARDMAGFAAREKLLEGLLRAPYVTPVNEKTREMCARNDHSLGQARRSFVGAFDSFFPQAAADFLGTPLAKFAQAGQTQLQLGLIRPDIEADDMQRLVLPGNGYLDARDQLYAKPGGGGQRLIDTVSYIMIGQRQYPHTGGVRPLHQLRWRERSVRTQTVCVHVVAMRRDWNRDRIGIAHVKQGIMITRPFRDGSYILMATSILPPTLAEAALRFKHAAAEINDTYEARRPDKTDQVTPGQLTEAIEQFLSIIDRIDREEGKIGPIAKDDATQLGDYGMTLIADLAAWASQLNLPVPRQDLEIVTLAAADWLVRHDGQIRTLEPVVNALANFANRAQDPASLEPLITMMGRVAQAAANLIKQDLEKNNPGRPWRVLHLNRGIVATRTHNPELMEKVFDDLVRYLPEDAAAFFAEGMQQMEELGYPPHVRQVMNRYFDRWTRPRMH